MDEQIHNKYIAELYRRFAKNQQLIDWYEPLPTQKEAFLSNVPIQVFSGTNRSGKTETVCAKVAKILLGKHPTIKRPLPQRWRFMTESLTEGAFDAALDKFKKFIPLKELRGESWEKALVKDHRKVYLKGGSTLQLMAYTQDVELFSQVALDGIVCDEEPPEKHFYENLRRLADKKGIAIVSFTPHKGITWLYQKLIRPAMLGYGRVAYHKFSFLDNYYIPRENHIKNFANATQREIEISLKGNFIANEGLVYNTFEENKHIISPFKLPAGTQLFLGVDFGLNNPTAGCLVAIVPNNKKYVVGEYYEVGRMTEDNGFEMGKWIKLNYPGYKLRWIVGDPNSGAQRKEHPQKNTMTIFMGGFIKGYGQRVSYRLGNRGSDVVQARVAQVNSLLTPIEGEVPELQIFSSCLHTIDEITSYVFPERKRDDINKFEKPKEFKNHLMNALEYVVEAQPTTIITKRRLIRNYSQYEGLTR